MFDESTTSSYLINEPFAWALTRVRTALRNAGFTISGLFDVSAHFRRSLVMNLPPCVVVFAISSEWAAEMSSEPGAAVLFPLHIVLAARGAQTEIHFLTSLPHLDSTREGPALASLGRLRLAVSSAVESVGGRNLYL